MADSFTTDIAQWQSVDDVPTAGSNNLIKSGGVYNSIGSVRAKIAETLYGSEIEQPTRDNIEARYINSSGAWVNGYGSVIIDVYKVQGKHITETAGYGQQYAFLKEYNDTYVTFVEEGGRISGTLNNTFIPYDANYLYYFCGVGPGSAIVPAFTIVEGETSSKFYSKNEINTLITLQYPLYFNTNNYVVFDKDITLSQNGDSIEVDVLCGCYNLQPNGYGFARGGVHSSGVGIGLSSRYIAVRADDGTFILEKDGNGINITNNPHYTFRMEYASGNINFYINGSLISTYQGQKTITLNGLGNGASYGNWNGILYKMKVNGIDYDMYKSIYQGNFVAPNKPKTMVEKSLNQIDIYRKYYECLYIKYPLKHSAKTFTSGEYPSYFNVWGLKQLGLCYWNGSSMTTLESLFRDGEAEMAVYTRKGDDSGWQYAGGSTHGFETIKSVDGIRQICIAIDNHFISEDAVFSLRDANSVIVTQLSAMVQPYTNSNPFADIVKKWTFDSDVRIFTSLKMTRALRVQMLQQGMFCVYRHLGGDSNRAYLTNKAFKNDAPFKVYELEDDWESVGANDSLKAVDNQCSKITEYGDTPLGFAMEIVDDNRASDGGMFVATNGSSYNKIYYQAHTADKTLSVNTEYYATQKWSIL